MSWYKTGQDGEEQQVVEEKKVEEEMNAPRRFWLPPNTSKNIVFLDSAGLFFKEHSYKAGGKWGNFISCLSDMGGEECPFCEDGMRYSYVCAFSIIDLSVFETKRDNIMVTASKKLFIAKGSVTKKLLKKRERQEGNLIGCKFEVTRYDKKEASTGSDFDFIERLSTEQMNALRMTSGPYSLKKEDWLVPYDYVKLFQPKTAPELRRILGKAATAGSDSDIIDIPASDKETAKEPGDSEAVFGAVVNTQDLSKMI